MVNTRRPLLSLPEAALEIGITESWLRRLVREGRVTPHRVGPIFVFTEADIETVTCAVMEELREGGARV
jgi:predicted DNA-binding transcriptional regulator AlpA